MARLYSTCAGFKLGETVLLVDSKLRQYLITLTQGTRVTVRRPLLWEYVNLMPRGPTPSYPKDIWAILGLLDVSPGACVLEAGSGSGALTLHLSRAVGPSGRVYSFDNSPEHLQVAQSNYNAWASAHDWPDNVHFVLDCVGKASSHCWSPLDAVALDLVEPSSVLSGILPLLKPGAPLVAYLPNVSQLMALSAHVLSQGQDLPTVFEVTHRGWTVKPAALKHGSPSSHFIARPSHNQQPHTGFLALLRRKP